MRRSNTSGANEQTVPCRFQHHFGEWLSEIAKYISLLLGVSGVSLHAIQSNVKRSKSAAQPKSITRQNVTGTNATRYALYNNEVQPVAKVVCVKCGQSHNLVDYSKFLSNDFQSKDLRKYRTSRSSKSG